MENLAHCLETYFSSDVFRTIVRQWAEGLDSENLTEEILNEKIRELSNQITESLNACLADQGIPSIPYLQSCSDCSSGPL